MSYCVKWLHVVRLFSPVWNEIVRADLREPFEDKKWRCFSWH